MSLISQNKTGVVIIEGHVQGLANTRALGEVGIPVIVIDTRNCIARYSKYCKKYFKCPPYYSEEFVAFLIDLCKEQNLQNWLLLPSNDHTVYSISKYKEKLIPFYIITTPAYSIIEKIYNKELLLNMAHDLGIPIPTTFFHIEEILNQSATGVNYPLITRGKFGLSFYHKTKKKAYIAPDFQKYKEQINEIKKYDALDLAFTQNVIALDGTNKTISLTAFCVKGEIKSYWIGEKLRDHPIGFGTATYSRSLESQELLEPSKLLVKKLNYTGVCEIEFLRDPNDDKCKLIEINARTWLWVGLAKACGINYPVMIYNYANGIEQNYPTGYKIGISWMHIYTDFFFSIVGILNGHYSIGNYFKSLFSEKIFAVFDLGDIKPFLHLSISLLSYSRKR